jgi:hypothetical protein
MGLESGIGNTNVGGTTEFKNESELSLPSDHNFPDISATAMVYDEISNVHTTEKSLLTSKYGLVDISIAYPQITKNDNHVNNGSVDLVNMQIYDDILSGISKRINMKPEELFCWRNERLEISLTYEIMFLNDNYISILYQGYINIRNGNYIEHTQGVTINIKTGGKAELGEFFNHEELSSIIKDNFFDVEKCVFANPIFAYVDANSELRKTMLPEYERLFLDREAISNVNDYYIKDNCIGIFAQAIPSVRENIIAEIFVAQPLWMIS